MIKSAPIIMDDCAQLARSAEWWGAEDQAENLAYIAECLQTGRTRQAMIVRGSIRKDRDSARRNRLSKVGRIAAELAFVAFVVWAIYHR